MKTLLAALLVAGAAEAMARTHLLDDFSDPAPWKAAGSDQVQASVAPGARGGLCLRYDFGRVSGYAVLRRALDLELPPHYALDLRLSGSGPSNTFQLKLVDASGDNVWWLNRPDYTPPKRPADLHIRQRHIEFAWGPVQDRTLRRAASIELVVASGQGGRGELCFERLSLTALPAPQPLPAPIASASSSQSTAAHALDGDPATAWRGTRRAGQHWQVDFGAPRELNGMLLRWADGRGARDFDVQFSGDGRRWRTVHKVRGSARDVLPIWLPERETRHLRLALRGTAPAGHALAEVRAMSPAEWSTKNAALASLAGAAPRGRFPRAFAGEQNYWTLIGVDGGAAHSALMSEDGAIEPQRAGPSLEPFVIDETGALASWADVGIAHSLRDGYLPLPRVRWSGRDFTLAIEAGADGSRTNSRLIAHYTVANTSSRPRALTLALAQRPWQVNPPRQFLNTPGGASTVQRLAWQDGALAVGRRTWLHALSPPSAVGAAGFETGDAIEMAARDRLPALTSLHDPRGLASAVLRWRLELAPGESKSVAVVLPLAGHDPLPAGADSAWAASRLDAIAGAWQSRLNRVHLAAPDAARPLVDTVKSALAQILMSRDGPALQPGTRSYARSWVRDGAMMVAGLLRLGEIDASREFVQWYAGHLFSDGKVPCCVDARGADPVAENDSHGQFIYAVAEIARHTGDRAFVEALWPKVDSAARYMEQLRQSRRTAAYREPGRESMYGLMPESISHEGYAAKPMHSYWDNFWALAGFRDAAHLAQALDKRERAAELERQRDEFAAELSASLKNAVAGHRIDHLPGAAELGDFDPSSSTMIFSPAGAEKRVPRALLESTWERYWKESVARRDGTREWIDYTPYELRSVSAFVRLDQPARAHAVLEYFLRDQRPAGWNGWAEVVGRLAREQRFVGDMPHAWVASDYIRSLLDLYAYERESEGALVLGAGIPESWWRAAPVEVRGLGTSFGKLDFRLALEAAPDGAQLLRIAVGPGLKRAPGGLWFRWTGAGTPPPRSHDGAVLNWQGSSLRLPDGGADLRLPLAAETASR